MRCIFMYLQPDDAVAQRQEPGGGDVHLFHPRGPVRRQMLDPVFRVAATKKNITGNVDT